MAQKKTFQELDLNNSFLFATALEDPEICRMILELILGTAISEVVVKTERTMLFSSDFRCIRMDVYALDEAEVSYNIEMQNQNRGNLAKRSRYHQAEMDIVSLKPGEDFSDLKPCYVIFICTFDPFSAGKYRYTFENRCVETGEALGDETWKIFLNTKGKDPAGVPQELIHFLHYIEETTDTYVNDIKDETVTRIHDKISRLKADRNLEVKYMTLAEYMEDEMEERRKEILEEGANIMLTLIAKMMADGIENPLERLTADADYRKEMLNKYNLML
ncbi:Rpn family recombination-promoting nuclease/putative transposase [Clostridium sp. MCC353]|uniref:Rpn family recombination-promoting nuclease/putative transposase n=1 Tax=Clostridium sp. MCC353 TaxID=2592646 RepID=UPI001C0394BD|nr:Rpn family recombination-promoting nuclease/putative transposase [Clostridium sp. MCC353]MBT9780105.1 Rpn family recombination-promoting nuclease/putative transposase [Clostridium sp. MCC353]